MTRSTALSVAVATCAPALSGAAPRERAADDPHRHAPQQHATPPVHEHPVSPPVYQQVDTPERIWTDARILARAQITWTRGARGFAQGGSAAQPLTRWRVDARNTDQTRP
jgi:hypothetical protein